MRRVDIELSTVVSLVDGLSSELLSLVNTTESTLSNLVEHLEDADVAGVLGDVEGLVNELLAKVQETVQAAGVNLDLAQLNTTFATVSNEVGSAIEDVQALIDVGVAGDVIDEIKSVLAEILNLVSSLASTGTLVGA